jgi:lipopolysaccharide biosynthesis glycosyltransferase
MRHRAGVCEIAGKREATMATARGPVSPGESSATVVLAADDNFGMPLAVAAFSIAATMKPGERLTFWVLDMGIGPKKREGIQRTLDLPNVDLQWIDSLEDKVQDLPNTWPNITRATYARLYIPEVLPATVSRALYVDGDVMARRSIHELFSIDMHGHAALGVPDVQSPFVSSPNGVPWWFRSGRSSDETNFNMGVLLMDLDIWRREEFGQQALAYLTDGRHEFGQDQEAINALFGPRIGHLDPRWNQQSEMSERIFTATLPYRREEIDSFLHNAWIVHFSNARKPWIWGCANPYMSEWFECLDRTAFAGSRPSFAKYVVKRARRLPRWAWSQAAQGR